MLESAYLLPDDIDVCVYMFAYSRLLLFAFFPFFFYSDNLFRISFQCCDISKTCALKMFFNIVWIYNHIVWLCLLSERHVSVHWMLQHFHFRCLHLPHLAVIKSVSYTIRLAETDNKRNTVIFVQTWIPSKNVWLHTRYLGVRKTFTSIAVSNKTTSIYSLRITHLCDEEKWNSWNEMRENGKS